MVAVKILRYTEINGIGYPIGAVIDVDDDTARRLERLEAAVPFSEVLLGTAKPRRIKAPQYRKR